MAGENICNISGCYYCERWVQAKKEDGIDKCNVAHCLNCQFYISKHICPPSLQKEEKDADSANAVTKDEKVDDKITQQIGSSEKKKASKEKDEKPNFTAQDIVRSSA